MKPLLLWVCLSGPLALLALPARAQELGSVAGHVICADSRTPCRFASVTIQSAPPKDGAAAPASPSHSYAAATDLEGAYVIKNVTPGEYYITALQAGYTSPYDLVRNETEGDATLKAQAAEIALERVAVAAGQTATANVLLSRGASLSGTVRYEDGGAAIQVPVNLYRKDGAGKWQRYSNSPGTGDLARLGFGPKTDDRGRFYAPGLPPGTYALQASLPMVAGLLSSITDNQSMGVKMMMGGALQVFYGNLYRLKDAKAIELREGEERAGLDINIPTSGMYSVGGSVVVGTEVKYLVNARVQLLDPDDKRVLREAPVIDGGFVFDNVRKGSYMVRVEQISVSEKSPIRYEPLLVPLLVESDTPNLAYALKPAKN